MAILFATLHSWASCHAPDTGEEAFLTSLWGAQTAPDHPAT